MDTVGVGRVFRSSSSQLMAPVSDPSAASSSRSSGALFVSGYSSSCFGGSGSAMVSFGNVNGSKSGNSRSFFTAFEDDNGDEDYEEYLNQAGKKRRLSIDQVQFLERSFEADNKLEPDRKTQLAKELGLQPRQVAIWFQNRRARWRTKQMEKDYDTLEASYNSLKSSYETLVKENGNLKAEVSRLSEKLVSKEISLPSAEPLQTSKRFASLPDNHISNSSPEVEDSKIQHVEQKLDDFTSAKSDIFQSDRDSPHYTNNVYSLHHLGHVDSPYMFQPDTNNSDLSQDEGDTPGKAYFPSLLPQIPSHEDHQPFWSWSF